MTNQKSELTKASICFVAHFAYGALAGGENGFIGGVERQTSMMAKWFATRGYQVSMLVCDEGQEDGAVIDGVKVFRMCRKEAGIKGLRFFWPKWTSLNSAMRRANADIYYQNCGEYVTGQVAMWCRKNGRKFVYSVASDPDCDKKLPEMHKIRERILYKYGLKHADMIIVQTKKQKDMLKDNFKCDSVIIPMPCPGPDNKEYPELEHQKNGSERVLWIGRVCEVKRPDRLLELARECPDVQFDFVGPKGNTEYSSNIIEQAKQIPNITYHGPASREKVSQFYQNARLMCCTSDFEGFPNTFLEAWSYGIPIVSTVDPDNLISTGNMGIYAKNIKELASGILMLINDSQKWEKSSQSARRYYIENHTVDAVMSKFENVFKKVLNVVQDFNNKKREELLCQ